MTFNIAYYELLLSILFYFGKPHQNAKKTGVVTSTFVYLFIYFVGTPRKSKDLDWI
jgi:hypothetical protein